MAGRAPRARPGAGGAAPRADGDPAGRRECPEHGVAIGRRVGRPHLRGAQRAAARGTRRGRAADPPRPAGLPRAAGPGAAPGGSGRRPGRPRPRWPRRGAPREAGDGPALAAARTRLRSALLRGSYAVTTAAVRSGDVTTAREWLLIREFRRATRFTRPGVDATVALDRLDERRTSSQRALLAVRKDLLDAYQARLSEQLEAGSKASRRGFAASQAQSGEFARGLWLILRPEYLRQRGAAATARADRALERVRARRPRRRRPRARPRPGEGDARARRLHRRALHPRRAGPARIAVPALPRPAADRVRRRHRRRAADHPLRGAGGRGLPRRRGVGPVRPRAGARQARPAPPGRRWSGDSPSSSRSSTTPSPTRRSSPRRGSTRSTSASATPPRPRSPRSGRRAPASRTSTWSTSASTAWRPRPEPESGSRPSRPAWRPTRSSSSGPS